MPKPKNILLGKKIKIPAALMNHVPLPLQDPAFIAYVNDDFLQFLAKYEQDDNWQRVVNAYWRDFRQATKPEKEKQENSRHQARAAAEVKRKARIAKLRASMEEKIQVGTPVALAPLPADAPDGSNVGDVGRKADSSTSGPADSLSNNPAKSVAAVKTEKPASS